MQGKWWASTLVLFIFSGVVLLSQSKPTYEIGGTKYLYNESYKTTGKPKVQRSSSAKTEFLKSMGYDKTPPGYQVDHIKPLSEGGADEPYNMQLITTEQHKAKTAAERGGNSSSSTYIKSNHKSTSTYKKPNYYSSPTYNYNSGRTIYTGPRGGQYYINRNGNKTYIKKK